MLWLRRTRITRKKSAMPVASRPYVDVSWAYRRAARRAIQRMLARVTDSPLGGVLAGRIVSGDCRCDFDSRSGHGWKLRCVGNPRSVRVRLSTFRYPAKTTDRPPPKRLILDAPFGGCPSAETRVFYVHAVERFSNDSFSVPTHRDSDGLGRSRTQGRLMDLNLYGRVLRRVWPLVLAGLALAVALWVLSVARLLFVRAVVSLR